MTDQHRWDALGKIRPYVKTPNLNRLADAGALFTQAACNVPMCVPSRYSMMTGLYGSQLGVRFNQQVCPTDADLPVPVIAQHFERAGYVTGGFGKTHWYEGCMGRMEVRQESTRRGFQYRGVISEGMPHMAEVGAKLMEDDYGNPVPSVAELNKINHTVIGESKIGYSRSNQPL